MKLYLLTAGIDHEGEDPVFLAASLEEAKAAATTAAAASPLGHGPDEYCIYEAEPGAKPELIIYAAVRGTWDAVGIQYTYALTDWSPA